MLRPFEFPIEGATVTLCGVLIERNGQGKPFYKECGHISPNEAKRPEIHWRNLVRIAGKPSKIKIFEVFQDERIRELKPFHQKDGIAKYSSSQMLYVSVEEENGTKTHVVSYYKFPTGLVIFEAGLLQKKFEIPKKSEELGRTESLTQRIEIPEPEKTPKRNKGNNGKKKFSDKEPDKLKKRKKKTPEKTGRMNNNEINEATTNP